MLRNRFLESPPGSGMRYGATSYWASPIGFGIAPRKVLAGMSTQQSLRMSNWMRYLEKLVPPERLEAAKRRAQIEAHQDGPIVDNQYSRSVRR